MSKIATWYTSQYSGSEAAHETDSLFYAEDVMRYMKFRSSVSLKYCVADAIRYTRSGQHITVQPGSFLLTGQGADMECLPNQPGSKLLFVYFTDALLADVQRNRALSDAALLDEPQVPAAPLYLLEHLYSHPNRLSGLLQSFVSPLSGDAESRRDIGPDVFYTLAGHLLDLQQDITRQMHQLPARSPATREELYRRLLQAQALMHDSWRQELTLGDMARHACLSPYHFHRSFRAAYGQSPGQWFRKLKLEKSREMLAARRWTVREVALHCGFADVFSFSKAFKKVYGVVPSEVGRGDDSV